MEIGINEKNICSKSLRKRGKKCLQNFHNTYRDQKCLRNSKSSWSIAPCSLRIRLMRSEFYRLQKALERSYFGVKKNKTSCVINIVWTFNIHKSKVKIPKFQFYPNVCLLPLLSALCTIVYNSSTYVLLKTLGARNELGTWYPSWRGLHSIMASSRWHKAVGET